jgi:DNA topoisomerase-3
MVAEKPSIALSITEALSNNYTKDKGVCKSCPIYKFNGVFKGHTATFKVTSVAGHVYNRDFGREYQDRRKDASVLF